MSSTIDITTLFKNRIEVSIGKFRYYVDMYNSCQALMASMSNDDLPFINITNAYNKFEFYYD
jgi:hypothetical protein